MKFSRIQFKYSGCCLNRENKTEAQINKKKRFSHRMCHTVTLCTCISTANKGSLIRCYLYQST